MVFVDVGPKTMIPVWGAYSIDCNLEDGGGSGFIVENASWDNFVKIGKSNGSNLEWNVAFKAINIFYS